MRLTQKEWQIVKAFIRGSNVTVISPLPYQTEVIKFVEKWKSPPPKKWSEYESSNYIKNVQDLIDLYANSTGQIEIDENGLTWEMAYWDFIDERRAKFFGLPYTRKRGEKWSTKEKLCGLSSLEEKEDD